MPPLPNFLPANRRRQLDPTRHLISRELWNKVRFHASASSNRSYNSTNNNDQQQAQAQAQTQQSQQGEQGVLFSSHLQWALALFRAITYELQPFCIKPFLRRIRIFICEEEGLPQLSASLLNFSASLLNSTVSLVVGLWKILHQRFERTSFRSVQSYLKNNKSLLLRSIGYLLLLRLWYLVVVYLHDLLHAGPILVILTLMALLFTVGLGDNTGAAASGIPSAYSVFNRGMRRILGTVDAEELARQYAGGAMMARAEVLNNQQHHNFVDGNDVGDDGNIFGRNNNEEQREESEEEELPLVNEQRRRRRLERLEQRRQLDDALHERGDENNDNHDNDADQAPLPHEENNDMAIQASNNNEGNTGRAAAAASATAAVAKKSGKKARRRNLEVRREMQRQRQAAAAMGFVGDGGDILDVDGGREREARAALLE